MLRMEIALFGVLAFAAIPVQEETGKSRKKHPIKHKGPLIRPEKTVRPRAGRKAT